MVSKLKGKEWHQIVAPKIFGDFSLGETLSIAPEQIKGRVVETSLTDITGDPNRYYFKFYFKVEEIKDGKAFTTFIGHDCTRDYISRIVRPRTSRIDTSDEIALLDNKMRVKTIAISNRAGSRSVESAIRKNVRDIVISEVSKLNTEDFIKQMIDGSLQSKIRKVLSKVYPLRFFEFRKTVVLQ
jgi:small subunit ribosomal protein S3Ae